MQRSKPRRGGPIPGDRLSVIGEPPSVNLTIRVSPYMRERWREAAEMVPESLSEFVRAACDEREEIVRRGTT
ncbi:MAG: hypothetical protein OXJ56_05080 [Rhodospirillaceae bacterium]|nr:hypothetical protein [Rhodospirillaceae bacterium]